MKMPEGRPVCDRSDSYPLWHCPGCGYHGIQNVTGGVGPWPGDGKVRCPSRTCEYATVMEQVGTLVDEARCDHTHDQDMAYIRERDAENAELREAARKVLSAHMAGLDMGPSLNRLEDAAGLHDMGGT